MCVAEKEWLSCKDHSSKDALKFSYVSKRKLFDREVQRAKRLYWYSLQKQLLDECEVDQTSFWKSIGKIGVNCSKNSGIPMEVVLPDGSISCDVQDVLARWKNDFSSLFRTSNADISSDNCDMNVNQEASF